MKKTLTTIATALIMVTSLNSFAAEKANPLKDMTSDKVITTYLEAANIGNVDFNQFLFAEDFEYRNTANNDRFNKKQYTRFLKENKSFSYDCGTDYEILSQEGQTSVAKAVMTFENFTRVDYITLTQSEDGWKVSNVVVTYP